MVKVINGQPTIVATSYTSMEGYAEMRENLIALLMHLVQKEDCNLLDSEISSLCDVIYILGDRCN